MNNLLALCAVYILKLKKRRNKRRSKKIWMKKWLQKREEFSHLRLLPVFECNDFKNYLRMDEQIYQHLLSLVTPALKKQDTHIRRAMSPHEKLVATLRYLATDRTYTDLQYSVAISQPSLSRFIPETCNAIFNALKKEYLKFPKSEEEWIQIGKEFEERWNFPNCLGSVDGKHVRIIPPPNSGSYYYNYKNYHSMVLLGIVNANYEFIMVDFGINGRISDGGVIENTIFYEKLKEKKLTIPQETLIMGHKLPYVFVGDEAFTLRQDFLKPYNRKLLNNERRIFNYRLSRCRRIVENVFGILTARFQIFQKAINLDLKNIEKIVLACCALHNFLRRRCSRSYTPPGTFYVEDTQEGNFTEGEISNPENFAGLQHVSRNCEVAAKIVRQQFVAYFNNEGAVSWQNKFTNDF